MRLEHDRHLGRVILYRTTGLESLPGVPKLDAWRVDKVP